MRLPTSLAAQLVDRDAGREKLTDKLRHGEGKSAPTDSGLDRHDNPRRVLQATPDRAAQWTCRCRRTRSSRWPLARWERRLALAPARRLEVDPPRACGR